MTPKMARKERISMGKMKKGLKKGLTQAEEKGPW